MARNPPHPALLRASDFGLLPSSWFRTSPFPPSPFLPILFSASFASLREPLLFC